jgi:hypothetical protein
MKGRTATDNPIVIRVPAMNPSHDFFGEVFGAIGWRPSLRPTR